MRSPPPGIPGLGLSRNDAKGSGERCTLACIDSKKRRYACDEIKLPVKEFRLYDEPPVTGTLALQDVRRHSQSNEKDR